MFFVTVIYAATVIIYNLLLRGVAQPGSAPAWGAGGRKFESSRPDHFKSSSTEVKKKPKKFGFFNFKLSYSTFQFIEHNRLCRVFRTFLPMLRFQVPRAD
jgi:hypothetical protein